ncbi:MAG: helix-turn-helix domain-containing protein [Verrucomicrobia bacterium]|nr:helix-turn-helix domain-containing protein [Verrucomicrobiota bacterium]
MLFKKLKELKAARDRLDSLEKTMEAELAALPAQFGFDSAQAFANAVVKASASGARPARKGGRPKAAAKPKRKRKRSVVTEELRTQVKQLAEAGQTGAKIKAATGLSLPTIQNIKKAFGLVKARAAS